MKYIRTINGIYIAVKGFKTGDMIVIPDEGLVKIIKQSNTIKELCDEFIVVHENGTHVIQKKVGNGLRDMDKDYPEYLERNKQVFYGAIWTDKGLIYVAKMNDKGELELL